jgi:pimeloyl-ACP methyl ester carboxylesterase
VSTPFSRSRFGRNTVAAINAFIGDRLEESDNELAIKMSLRHAGADLVCDRRSLRLAYPNATGRIAVFLHGLLETEEWWLRGPTRRRAVGTMPFAEGLRRDLGVTAVFVRYNTGLHVSENGAALARLLESLTENWAITIEQLALLGHSMGGLVARSACHAARRSGYRWPDRVRHLVTLGTPHTGAPLEKAVHVTSWILGKVPEARPLADVLELRSAGIQDLRFGYVCDEEWHDDDRRKLLDDRRVDLPLLPECTYTFITATVTRDPAHALGWMLGDLLVRTDSASGRHRERRIPVPDGGVVHIGGLHHFDLLDHPLVYERLREALHD